MERKRDNVLKNRKERRECRYNTIHHYQYLNIKLDKSIIFLKDHKSAKDVYKYNCIL